MLTFNVKMLTGTCVISNFQIKILPEYWNVFWYMLQAGCLGCRLGWSLVLGCVSGVPFGSTLWNQEGRNKVGQREGSSWITGQMTWADHMGVWSDDGPPGLSWHIQWPVLYTSTQMGHCMQAAPRGAGGLRLPTGSTYSCWTMNPWREIRTARLHVPSGHVSQLQR